VTGADRTTSKRKATVNRRTIYPNPRAKTELRLEYAGSRNSAGWPAAPEPGASERS
jgi:hypothetical protein